MSILIRQIWTANPYRNFNYLVACPETGEALAIDPLDFRQCLAVASAEGWTITQVLNTHHHGDHTGGNKGIIDATGARLIAHHEALGQIPNIDEAVGDGDRLRIGRALKLECLDTPGHTMSHICALYRGDQPALFSGDTLFNAGAGNCHNGGHPEALFDTFDNILKHLDPATSLYPGHDYLQNNLEFTLDREPDNHIAAKWLAACDNHDPANARITTLAEEFDINVFFRLNEPGVVARLRESFPELPESPDPRTVFLKLRELRNSW